MIAVTIPAWLPEKVCWALSDEYHAPKAVGGHVRIYTENELRTKMRGAGLDRRRRPPRPRPALALLVAQVRGGHHQRRLPAREAATTGCWCGTSTEGPPVTRVSRAAAQPGAGQEPGRLRHQADRPRRVRSRQPRQGGGTDRPVTHDSIGRPSMPLPEVPGILTAAQIGRDRRRHRVVAAAQRHDPLVPGRPRRPVEPRRGGHGPGHRRPPGRRRAGLPVAGRLPAPRRLVAPVLPGRLDRAGQARRQRHRLRGHRRLAPPPAVRRRRLPGGACGRRSRRPSTSCSTCRRPAARSSGPATPTAPRGRSPCSPAARASATACAAPSPSPSTWATSAPTGS